MPVKNHSRTIDWKRTGYLLLLSISVALVFVFWGCSPVPRHNTLTFFFDGVPAPEDKTAKNNPDTKNKPDTAIKHVKAEQPSTFYHAPFKKKQCDACHDQSKMGKFVKRQPELCYQCHENFSKTYKFVHGPVAGGYCTACHAQHSADNKKLLKRKSQQLCLYCHSSSLVFKNEVHKDIADANCTECHNPHGGEDRTMIK
jgi:predicted CXXCH cytochrome family protein